MTEKAKVKNIKTKDISLSIRNWFIKNKFYLAAFFMPVIIMYAAYVVFKIYPFGDKSVLVLDLSGQYAYYFDALKDAFWNGDKSVLYSWSRNLSGGFAGIIGYYLSSPFTVIVLLLPEKMFLGSLLIMLLAKLGSAGLTFFYYLRKSKNHSELHSLIFSLLYALCAYGVIQLMNPMWLDGMVFLPLIILGIEYLIDEGKKLNFIIPLAVMIIANFYIGYMICIFSAIYFIVYTLFLRKNVCIKKQFREYPGLIIRMTVSSLIAVMCAAVVLLPMYNALKLGKFDFSKPDYSYKTQFSFADFFAQFIVGQYDAMTPDGHPEVYCGIFTAMLIPLFFMNRKISELKKTGYSILAVLLIVSMYVKPLDMIWHGFQMPNWMPFRYSFILSFILLIMAADAFKNLRGIKLSSIAASFTLALGFLLVVLSRIKENDITKFLYDKVPDITKKDVWITLTLAAVYCAIIFITRKLMKNKNKYNKLLSVIIPSVIIVISCGELLYNCVDTLKNEDTDHFYPSRSNWYNYINNGNEITKTLYEYDDSFYRCEKTFHRMANDNAALGLRGVSHSNSVMNAKILKFLKAVGYSATTYYSRYEGATPLADSLLGIKYSMDRNLKKFEGTDNYRRLSSTSYKPVFTYEYNDENNDECVVDAYENPYALSIGFMADKDIMSIGEIKSDDVFYNQNILMSTISGNTDIDYAAGTFNSYSEYYKKIDVNPDSFVLNNVTTSPYNDQTLYTSTGAGDPTVDMFITVPSENPIYLFFNSDNEKAVNLWVSHEQDEAGNYINHHFVNTYFDVYTHCAMCLGSFEPGETINLRMTVTNEYAAVKNFLFYEFDEKLFADSINSLKQNQWELTKITGRSLEGTITAENDKMMLTSIPYEPGWKITVDGKKTEPKEVFNALIGINLTPGNHTIKMTYMSPGLITGIIISSAGIIFIALICIYDKKRNKASSGKQ